MGQHHRNLQAKTGEQFVQAMLDRNLIIAFSKEEPRPFRLIEPPIDATKAAKNHNLVRELQGVTTAQIREMLKDVKLPRDKDVMERIRTGNLERIQQYKGEQTQGKIAEAKTESKVLTYDEQRQRDIEYAQELMRARSKDRGLSR